MLLHHVQVGCPRGGAWFRSQAGAEIHVGVEDPFAPARKAHPALLLGDVAALEATAARLADLGLEVDCTQRDTFPDYVRCHTFDGHGNRVELLAAS